MPRQKTTSAGLAHKATTSHHPERHASPWLDDCVEGRAIRRPWQSLDQALHSTWAQAFGVSPAAISGAVLDWAGHFAMSTGKMAELQSLAIRQWMDLCCCLITHGHTPCVEQLSQDKRFARPEWKQWPFTLYASSFLYLQSFWNCATTHVPGVSAHHEAMMAFGARQLLDAMAPSNFVLTNPIVLNETIRRQGANLVDGACFALDDLWRQLTRAKPAGTDAYKPGVNVAVTPGQVIFRNHLIELIQYFPSTPKVHAEPILIVPAWIMKYYILDLSPENSLIRYLVGQGFTVFAISWKNPGQEDRNIGMNDYLRQGVMAALQAIRTIRPDTKIHTAGYCLGGTLLAIAAAQLARDKSSDVLASATFFTTQVDFSAPGELSLFIDESQVHFLEELMWQRGYLDSTRMSTAFRMLRSNDLIWSYRLHKYLLGKREPMNDLMAWNADSTRLPYKMHSEYLRKLFLNNELAHGEYKVEGQPVSLSSIRIPLFCVAAITDHVAPWRSVFKIHGLAQTSITFVLTSGGHNAGIVSPPRVQGLPAKKYQRNFQMTQWTPGMTLPNPDEWLERTQPQEGSWWTAWAAWLKRQSSGELVTPPATAPCDKHLSPLTPAPGQYVTET